MRIPAAVVLAFAAATVLPLASAAPARASVGQASGSLVDVAVEVDGATTPLVDPCTGRTYGSAPRSSSADIDDAVGAAHAAFDGWRSSTPSERSLALLRIADALEKDAERFIDAECRNTGKPKALMASDEIPPSVDQLRFFAGAARMLEGRGAGEYMAGLTSFIRREPIGALGGERL